MSTAKQKEVAAHLFITPQHFINLTKEGVFEHRGRAGYDLDDCRRRYIEYLRGRAKAARGGEAPEPDEAEIRRQKIVDDINKERARQAAETADKLAMENAVRRGELVPVTAMRDAMAKAGSLIRARLESLPAQMKRRLPFLRSADLAVVKQEITKLTDELASIDIDHEGSS